jgi:molybdopterin biosynthesis enzyme
MTNAAGHETTYTIYVNTRPTRVTNKHQNYESVVELATGAPPPEGAVFTVTFEETEHSAPRELVAGGKDVTIVDGKSRFYVEETGQS